MRTVRSIALGITLSAGVIVVAPVVGGASPNSCPSATQQSGEIRAAAREVTEDYPTIQAAADAVGVPMTSNRQVIAVMAYPTFVDIRVAASDDPCHIIGAVVTTKGLQPNAPANPLVWTPPFPTFSHSGVGERFVSSTAGSITIEFRDSPTSKWRRYVATSNAMRWTSCCAPVTGAPAKAPLPPISSKERLKLGAAINRTLSAKSVRIDVRWPTGDGKTRLITLNRPDRAREETTLPSGIVGTSISIGRDTYETLAAAPGTSSPGTSAPAKWSHTRRPVVPEGTFESTLGLWLQAEKFHGRDGTSYVGEMSDGGSLFEVKAQIADARVVQLTVTLTNANPMTKPRILPAVMRLSKFDAAPKIVAPSASQTAVVRRS